MATGTPDVNWYRHFRRRTGDRGLVFALVISGIFHLSMVTVFRIVTYIPRVDIQYSEFTIVPIPRENEVAHAAETGPVESEPGTQLALRGFDSPGDQPPLQLPTLEFAELGRLRVREASLPSPVQPEQYFREPSDDSWARFSRGLSNLSRSLTRLRLSGGEDTEGAASLPLPGANGAGPVSRPAEGFEARVVWATDPRDRKLLFSPPIEALWNADPALLAQPIEMVLQVNALGRVVNVFSPSLDARELVDAVQLSALQYRFEPLPIENAAVQTATLRIQREASGAGK